MSNPINPFGNPEGARADIEEVTRGFVSFPDPLVWKGLATQPSDLTARLLVGQKGSGKTVYLRRARDFAASSPDIIAVDIEESSVATSDVKRISLLFQKYELRENWSLVWQRALLRAATSHLINNEQFAPHIGLQDRGRMRTEYALLLRATASFRKPVGVFNAIADILRHTTRNSLHTYLHDPLWGQLEAELADLLRHAPPLCLYLDGVDDRFQHAPMHWLEFQIGLFDAVMHLLRDARFGGRLHVFATLRDLVYLKILQGEHALRNFEEPHIRLLSWDSRAIERLLKEKIRVLDDTFFQFGKEKTIHSWLGGDTIYNERRHMEEPILQYLLRHTRLLPRDIVTLGNILCQELYRLKWFPEVYRREEAIARGVRFAARKLGVEQIAICAHQLSLDQEPAAGARRPHAYESADEYVRTVADDLRAFIKTFGNDHVKRSVLQKQDDVARTQFGERTDVLTVLWLNDLLGYVDDHERDGRVVFYSTDSAVDFKLPRDKQQYAFHSCMIDAVGLRPIGRPVVHAQ